VTPELPSEEPDFLLNRGTRVVLIQHLKIARKFLALMGPHVAVISSAALLTMYAQSTWKLGALALILAVLFVVVPQLYGIIACEGEKTFEVAELEDSVFAEGASYLLILLIGLLCMLIFWTLVRAIVDERLINTRLWLLSWLSLWSGVTFIRVLPYRIPYGIALLMQGFLTLLFYVLLYRLAPHSVISIFASILILIGTVLLGAGLIGILAFRNAKK